VSCRLPSSPVEAAEVPEVDVWAERIMTASRLEDVLGPTPA
jgi:hypothetical protein